MEMVLGAWLAPYPIFPQATLDPCSSIRKGTQENSSKYHMS